MVSIKSNTLTIVVPCYNEEAVIDEFIQEILKTQETLPDIFIELILVNDGSKDGTKQKLKELALSHRDRITYISLSRNFGKEAALLAGLEHAQGEFIAVMDADLQDPPSLLKEMLDGIITEGYDVVGTRRTSREGEPPIRSWFANLYYKLNNKISDVYIEEGARDFRVMTYEVVQSIISLTERNRFSKGLFAWVGYNVKYLEYPNIEREAGESSWSFRSLFNYAIEGLISFSEVPLTIATWVGFLSCLGAFGYGLFVTVRTLLYGAITPGWTSLAVMIIGMGGLQLLCLGIVGKYIGKIYIESKQRPVYIIQESIHNQHKHF